MARVARRRRQATRATLAGTMLPLLHAQFLSRRGRATIPASA
ncbi:hypothetical protein [Sphingomicrobium aestuariivivum]|nr:hypothetical protein [Sphingomicrobium aestuariivivum]